MKNIKLIIVWALILAMLAFAGCASGGNNGDGGSADADNNADSGDNADGNTGDSTDTGSFSYSEGIEENGFWTGVTALDYVKLCDYKGIEIPEDVHTITDETVQEQVDSILENYADSVQITDRAVEDGDTVNIDYVGTVGGVEFEGGNTEGAGADVTIGVTNYIDDFLEQLIGHMPGDEFDVNVTFPENYGKENLNGKDAVFAVKINYISESILPELTDEFVSENLKETNGWTTVNEMRDGIRKSLQTTAIGSYVQNYVVDNSEVTEIPESIMKYVEDSMLAYYEQYAARYGIELDAFLTGYVGVESAEALLKEYEEDNRATAKYYLIVQAIAEQENIGAVDSDIAAYFEKNMGISDYTQYESAFGHPYLVQVALFQNVLTYLTENAVMK